MAGKNHKPGCRCFVCNPLSDAEKFWRFVEKSDGCWNWRGGIIVGSGYGGFNAGRPSNGARRIGAHRFSYELHYGPIPDGMSVCHRCDNRACVRPDHLFLGTHQDNMDDMHRKGRWTRWAPGHERHWDRTHCVRGHEFTQENTRIRKRKEGTYRVCRTCSKLYQAAKRHARAARDFDKGRVAA